MNAERLLAVYDRVADAPGALHHLRRFVIDLAVRGKLVEQNPTDEPASELLKRIAAEKARLLKAGKLRRRKLASRLDELPFSLPKGWDWARIREVLSDRGQVVPDHPFTYIDVSAIDEEAGLIADPRVVEPDNAPSRARRVARTGDVVYSCVRPYLLNVAIIEADFNPRPIASTAFEVLNGHGLVLPRYTWMVLRSSFMIACVEQRQRGQAYPAINSSDFAVLPFPLPPLAEQRRIVAKVDELMALCDGLEETRAARADTRDRLTRSSLARLTAPNTDAAAFRGHARFAINALPALTARADQVKHLRQTILSLAVRGKLVEQDPADEPASELLERIDSARKPAPAKGRKTKRVAIPSSLADTAFSPPTGWAHARLSQLVRVLNGRAYKKAELLDSGTPVLRVGNLFTSKHWYYSDLRLAEDKYCDEGDLLYAWSASFGPVIWQGPRAIFHYHIWKLSLFSEADLDKRFLYYFLLQQTQEIKSAGHGISMVHMTKGKMERLAVPVPPLAEQRRIVTKVDELMALCDRLEEARVVREGTRDRLLDSLLHEVLLADDATAERPTQFNWLPGGRHG